MDDSQRYERAKHFVSVIGFVLDLLILIYLLTSRLTVRIRESAEAISSSHWVSIVLYVLAVGAIFKVFDLFLSFYSGYVLEHRFGLSRQSLAGWVSDEVKALALGVPFSIAAVEVVYGFLRLSPSHWWIY